MSVNRPLMIDLFCGLKGASGSFKAVGWEVVTVDINPRFEPHIVADIRKFTWKGRRPRLVWASPPCDEFARESMPWCKTGKPPSMHLINATLAIIEKVKPVYWVIENVRGALPYMGGPQCRQGPFYMWGFFPAIPRLLELSYKKKESYGSNQKELRAKIPAKISEALAHATMFHQPLIETRCRNT